jgi:hypothetical protein
MAAVLEIDDGATASWEGPDIWVVPGSDPLGAVGTPVAGQPAYLWARVHNRGNVDVISARVDYWWSNPSIGVIRSLSTKVGSAFVDLPAGSTEEVLCLVPWVPVFVNGGHECLVCEVISPADPLPTPPPDVFDAPTYHQIAQRNISVLAVAQMAMAIQIATDPRDDDGRTHLAVEVGGELDQVTLATLGLAEWRPAKEHLVTAGLADHGACGTNTAEELHVKVQRGVTPGAFLHVHPAHEGEKGTYTVIRVVQDRRKSRPGITYVALGGGDRG